MAAGLTLRAMAMGRSGLVLHSSMDASRSLHKLCPLLFRTYSTLPSQQHRRGARLNRVALPPSIRTRASKSEPSGGPSYLHKLRSRHLQDSVARPGVPKDATTAKKRAPSNTLTPARAAFVIASSFKELPLSDELLAAVENLQITAPTEVQCRAIPAVLEGQSVVVASHTGSGKTLAYMIPIVQCLRKDELEHGKASRPRRPRAVVLCPTRELAEQVFRVAKSLCHHARFRAALIGGGVRMKPQEDALNSPIDMLVGTPGRLLKHIEDKNMAYGDIKYVVLDEADTMFDRGFGPDVRKFLGPLRNRSNMPEDPGFQTVLVTATITKAVQKLLDEEFPGIRHIQTSTLHKKVSTAKHSFIKLDGSENKLESLLQVLEPSLAKGERVMVFCNTLDSCRAVDHFLNENNIKTVNYHGAVPADERVEVLEKFKNEDRNCPALVCTDLAARGLDLVVDHVLMFDFPLNSIDYLHRTGRTARMGAKGKITSLVTKRSLFLAEQIEEAIRKGETLEGLPSQKPAVQTNSGLTKSKLKESGEGRVVTKTASKAKSVSAKKLKPVTSVKKSPVVRVSKSKAATSSVRSPNSKAIRVPKPKAPKVRAPAKATQSGSKYGAKKASSKVLKVSGRR